MGWLDFFDPDAIVQKIDKLEQTVDKVVNTVDDAAAKVENTAGIVEKKAGPGNGSSPQDDAALSAAKTGDTD